jgi:hypothetical protein
MNTFTYAASDSASSEHSTTGRRFDDEKRGNRMQLHRAFELAVILSWRDLMKVVTPACVRIEYQRESESLLDHVILWADKGKGYCDRVCDYWTWASSAHPNGIRFWRGHDSKSLTRSLDFIMNNQDYFTASKTARDGLVLVYPPRDGERAQAVAWEAATPRTSAARERQSSLASNH